MNRNFGAARPKLRSCRDTTVSEADIDAQDRALLKAFLKAKVVIRQTALKQPARAGTGDFSVLNFTELVVRPFQPRPCHRATEPPLCAPARRTSSTPRRPPSAWGSRRSTP
jgi:hypothetical protein